MLSKAIAILFLSLGCTCDAVISKADKVKVMRRESGSVLADDANALAPAGVEINAAADTSTDQKVLATSASALEVSGMGQVDATQLSSSQRRRRKSSGSCSSKDESQCDSSGACSWAGDSCKSKCAGQSRDDCKSSGYCTWKGYSSGECREEFESIKFGGITSKITADTNTAWRPELLTFQHLDASGWTDCGGTANCFHGHKGSDAWRYWDTRVSLDGSTFTKASVEVAIKCKTSSDSIVEVAYDDNDLDDGTVQAWYNRAETNNWDRRRRKNVLQVPISSTDDDPIFRMEIECDAGSACSLETDIELKNVKAWFDACMGTKASHGQCLEVFADGSDDCRSDSAKQLAMLTGTTTCPSSCKPESDTTTTCTLCCKWKNCLTVDAKDMIVNAIEAFDLAAVQSALLQKKTIDSTGWTGNTCTSGDHPVCENPARLDVQGFDCICYNDIVGKSPLEIQNLACPKRSVCCDWKKKNCNNAGAYTIVDLLQGDDEEDGKKTMSNRSEHASLAEGASLDESLSGKRCR